ncbi:ceramide kinase isoform X2 [Juglans microcarpa x Juglans regia]|uniref:ceramide kinase isoform X2 n=1 Tax=Juglans microcarpa x Juglans regia TaxID=2249226 RepID=UPI001B7E1FFB|nr:ceramide kinase isoform X2 [Juglans microcarpa x Juglans regia]
MERIIDDGIAVKGENPAALAVADAEVDGKAQSSSLSSTLFLDHVGQVILTFNADGLSWSLVQSFNNDESSCLGIKLAPKVVTEIKFSDVYAVELIDYGLVHESNLPNAGKFLVGHDNEMYWFKVHGFQRSKSQPSLWVLAQFTFGHNDPQMCQMWVNRINASLNLEMGRPRNILVFVHPRSGIGSGCRIWETVAPIFSRAKVKTKVTVTQRAGQAFHVMASTLNQELYSYDGVVAVGGDGFFNEILNGFLSSRHKAPYPPSPTDIIHSADGNGSSLIHHGSSGTVAATSYQKEDESPLLSSTMQQNGSGFANFNQDRDFRFSEEQFRFGIIPAGSTDAIVMCTTGTRDPITSALHIVLGKRVCLDVAQVVRWKTTSASKLDPCVRYAASFAGYGFYGDVITESEKYRWMGPKRYDYAGTKVFLRHRSYEAEVAYLEVKSGETNSTSGRAHASSSIQALWTPNKSERVVCRVNCAICNDKPIHVSMEDSQATTYSRPEETRWLRSKGRFLSIGAAVISCRNERAPDGLVADAHLSDGFLNLILIKDCPHALYLWHLTQLARRGGTPLNFKFVEHHKTTAFVFTSFGTESVWNLDGEPFQAHQLSAQVFRGLVSLFASGPEV